MKTETDRRRSRQIPWLTAAVFELSIILINGCASVQEGSAEMKQQALSFTPPSGKAGIYVVRPDEYIGAGLAEISFDYQEYGSLQLNSYLFGTVLPGEHTLRCHFTKASSEVVHFTVEAGKSYYFATYHRDDGLISLLSTVHKFTLVVVPIPELKGQAYVRKFRLSADNRFEVMN